MKIQSMNESVKGSNNCHLVDWAASSFPTYAFSGGCHIHWATQNQPTSFEDGPQVGKWETRRPRVPTWELSREG